MRAKEFGLYRGDWSSDEAGGFLAVWVHKCGNARFEHVDFTA